MDTIAKLVEEGKLIMAGPYGKNEMKLRGLFIFNATNPLHVSQYLQGDSAIIAGYLKAEIIHWYGSAALPAYLPQHQMIWK